MNSSAPRSAERRRPAGAAAAGLVVFAVLADPVSVAGQSAPAAAAAQSAYATCAAESAAVDEIDRCLDRLAAAVEDELGRVHVRAEVYFEGLDALTGNQRGSRTLAQSQTAYGLFRDLACQLVEIDQGIGRAAALHGRACRIDHDRARIAGLVAMIGQADDTSPEARPSTAVPEELVGSAWRVVEIAGEPTDADVATTFEIAADGAIDGSGGCNRYFGNAEIDADGGLRFGGIGATRMACPEPIMAQENRYFATLEEVSGFRLADGTLAFTGPDDAVLVRLERQSD